MTKELKTSEELKALLDEGVRRFSLGSEPNAQWIRIVPADSTNEEANWKVAHSGTPGDYANAIERVMRELQQVYDLLPMEQ